ncbi:CARDB domain-containing protein [Bradyrhizobium centrosematis]|uniref:CARDB domain-containing protein n=1 Tax=Bradyrhizobium centrosematis TaxID=1300039 RepID=UPI00216759D7|nr:CARDB domain-containing protein [Bradyrhizobium centrosematis]MCS3765307.1 serralysin [Bradyrhizobium centrosematis]MCS3773993.1 serralysin [Bradyrhizobium centrosematis]
MATAVTVSKTNNADIDGLLSGYKWSGTITYSFPDSSSDYASSYTGGDSEPTTSGFASAPTQMQAGITYAIALINGYTNANIQYAGTNGADIMIAQSPAANPTSYAYYPGNYASGGDIWFGTQYNYSQAKLGNYYFATALHELGHAVGLKHSQETGGPANVAVPSAHDDSEYTIMSYRSYVGASTTSGYTNEAYGYSQTYMANDILALQTMYDANFNTQSGATVYTWNPTTGQEFINGVGQLAPGGGVGGSANRIYETIWDGGGVDTYDLSNYTTNLSINLNPGAASLFSSVQLANLGDGHYASGNVYNAYLYNNDARSYIDNAIGGSGNDTIFGNSIANVLNGGGGNDTLIGGGSNDTIIGGSGTDIAVFSGNRGSYFVSYNAATQTFTLTDLRSGSPDGTDTVTGVESLQFADGTFTSASFVGGPPNLSEQVFPSTTSVAPGATISLSAFTVNYGSGTAAGSTSKIYISTDSNITTSDLLLATLDTGPLTPVGQSGYYDHHTLSVTLPANLAPGTYYLGGIADYNNQVAETNETDNTYNVTTITVTGAAILPNLSEQVFPSVTSATPGASISLTTFIVNYGEGAAAASASKIYLSADPNITTSDMVLATLDSGPLTAVGQSGYYDHHALSVTLPVSLAPGTYYLGGIADSNNQVAESNETDNTYNVTAITVTGAAILPNLSEQVFLSAASAAAGATISVSTFVVNYGNGAAAASTSKIYLSADSNITTSDLVLANVDSGPLNAVGQSGYYDHHTLSVVLPANLAPGTYYLGGLADYSNQVVESNETDNTYNVVQIKIGPAAAASFEFNAKLDHVATQHSFIFAPRSSESINSSSPAGLDHFEFKVLREPLNFDADPKSGIHSAEVENSTLPMLDVHWEIAQHHLGDFLIQ